MPVGEQGWSHRQATFTVANLAFGSSAWGNNPAPFAPRKYPWQVQVTGYLGYDAAKDALALAIGAGYPVRVVQITDQGYERVCNGVGYDVGAPFSVDSAFAYGFNVIWEFNSFWTERNPVNAQRRSGGGFRSGQTSPSLRSGAAFAVQITSTTFTVPTTMVDASVIGPGGMPNQADTGPVITITGPYGGPGGFVIQNFSDRYGAYIFYAAPLTAGQSLVIDMGAWSATLLQGGVSTDVTGGLSGNLMTPYLFAITPGVANTITLTPYGAGATIGATSSIGIQWQRYFL
jgi:hypothetical protein